MDVDSGIETMEVDEMEVRQEQLKRRRVSQAYEKYHRLYLMWSAVYHIIKKWMTLRKQVLEIWFEKEKMLVTSTFYFSSNVSYSSFTDKIPITSPTTIKLS